MPGICHLQRLTAAEVVFCVDGEVRAELEELSADFHQRLARIQQLREQAERVTASARSRDGLISVEVGFNGQLRAVHLNPGVYDRLSPQRLAAALVELAGIAAADAAKQAQQIMAPVLPAGGLSAGGDPMALMPQAPSMLGGAATGWPGVGREPDRG